MMHKRLPFMLAVESDIVQLQLQAKNCHGCVSLKGGRAIPFHNQTSKQAKQTRRTGRNELSFPFVVQSTFCNQTAVPAVTFTILFRLLKERTTNKKATNFLRAWSSFGGINERNERKEKKMFLVIRKTVIFNHWLADAGEEGAQ